MLVCLIFGVSYVEVFLFISTMCLWFGSSKIVTNFVKFLAKNCPTWCPKGSQIQAWRVSGRVLGGCWLQDASWTSLGRLLDASWGRLGRFLTEQVANMAPTWVPKWSQNCLKIDPENHQHFDSFFWNPSWSHVGHVFSQKSPETAPR